MASNRVPSVLCRLMTPPALVEVVEAHPGFEGFLGQVAFEGDGGGERGGAIDDECAVLQFGCATQFGVQCADVVAEIGIECPAGERLRRLRYFGGCAAFGEHGFAGGPFEIGDARLQSVALRGQLGQFGLRRLRLEGAFAVPHAGEGGDQLVILALRNGIELVIVAAGAVDGEAEERLADGADDVLQFVLPDDGFHRGALLLLADFVVRPGDEEAGGDQGVGVVRVQGVAGELQPRELVVGEVLVEGVDDPVAVAPGVGAELVPLEALALAVTGDVEPVARPAFAEVLRRKELLDGGCVRGIGSVLFEPCDVVEFGREADEVEGDASQQGARVGGGGGGETGCLQSGGDESVDFVSRPLLQSGRCEFGGRGADDRLQAPPVVAGARFGRVAERVDAFRAPRRTGGDPVSQSFPFVIWQRFVGGHLIGGDALPEEAVVDVARRQGRPAVAAGQRRFAVGEVESGFRFGSGMAGQAARGEQGRDARFEIDRSRFFVRRDDRR